ncbi:MAG: hypothetical protein GY756_21450 [bacterium]|nr:hypothetical protein [bacterium]
MNNPTVQFGKYKGQQLSVMLLDMNYVKWLLDKEDWLKTSYPEIWKNLKWYKKVESSFE